MRLRNGASVSIHQFSYWQTFLWSLSYRFSVGAWRIERSLVAHISLNGTSSCQPARRMRKATQDITSLTRSFTGIMRKSADTAVGIAQDIEFSKLVCNAN